MWAIGIPLILGSERSDCEKYLTYVECWFRHDLCQSDNIIIYTTAQQRLTRKLFNAKSTWRRRQDKLDSTFDIRHAMRWVVVWTLTNRTRTCTGLSVCGQAANNCRSRGYGSFENKEFRFGLWFFFVRCTFWPELKGKRITHVNAMQNEWKIANKSTRFFSAGWIGLRNYILHRQQQ